jgi:hypothetical protein
LSNDCAYCIKACVLMTDMALCKTCSQISMNLHWDA